MENPNKNLQTFYEEMRALLKKYGVALDIKAEIVAVDISKLPKEQAANVGLVHAEED